MSLSLTVCLDRSPFANFITESKLAVREGREILTQYAPHDFFIINAHTHILTFKVSLGNGLHGRRYTRTGMFTDPNSNGTDIFQAQRMKTMLDSWPPLGAVDIIAKTYVFVATLPNE